MVPSFCTIYLVAPENETYSLRYYVNVGLYALMELKCSIEDFGKHNPYSAYVIPSRCFVAIHIAEI